MKIPEKLTLEAVKEFARDVYQQIQALTTGNIDLKGRRVVGAGEAVSPFDYVRKIDFDETVRALNARMATFVVDERRTALQPDVVGDWTVTGNLRERSYTAFIGTFDHAITAARTWTFPDATDDVVLRTTTQTVTRKTIGDPTDQTKALSFTLSGATTAKTVTLVSSHTLDRSITLPNDTGTLDYSTTTLTQDELLLGAGSSKVAPLGDKGVSTSVLHGNNSGAPTWALVDLTSDVDNELPITNGGTDADNAADARANLGAAESSGVGAGSVTLAALTGGGTTGSISWNDDGCITGAVDPT